MLFYSILLGFTALWYNSGMFSGWASYFLLGIAYILWYFKKIKLPEYIIVSIIATIVSLQFKSFSDVLIAWTTIILVRFAQDWQNIFTKFYGDRSYSFYLLHSIIGAPVINFLSHRLIESWQKPLVILLGFLISTIAAHYFFILVEKPSMKWSKSIKYKI
jgi:peptidoglycan/LPS O-acetylase OafA/YrhL